VVIAKMGDRQIENKETVADVVAVGALKYTVLKQAVDGDIVYDPAKMTNLEGDTGPYLQYTYARARSVLRKSAGQQTRKPVNRRIQRWSRLPEEM
jgi:arginyl-tRNA synthetase